MENNCNENINKENNKNLQLSRCISTYNKEFLNTDENQMESDANSLNLKEIDADVYADLIKKNDDNFTFQSILI